MAMWPILAKVSKRFVLYGGTAIALRLAHRESVDFDFFTSDTLLSYGRDMEYIAEYYHMDLACLGLKNRRERPPGSHGGNFRKNERIPRCLSERSVDPAKRGGIVVCQRQNSGIKSWRETMRQAALRHWSQLQNLSWKEAGPS